MTDEIYAGTFKMTEPGDPFAKLPALAARLGVAPLAGSERNNRTMFYTAQGEYYDMFDLINAVLDRVDAVSSWQSRG